MNSSERLKQRWRERPHEMRAILAKANSPESANKRNRTRWAKDPDGMRKIAIRNAAKGTAKLTGSKFSRERLREHSEALTGRKLTGQMERAPHNLRAKEFALVAPDGQVYRGRNLLHFVRENIELFDAADVIEERGTTNAAKSLWAVVHGKKKSWKGWTGDPQDSPVLTRSEGRAES